MTSTMYRPFQTSMLSKKNLPKFAMPCDYCRVISTKLKKCGRCKMAYYCNAECQKAHWVAHKTCCPCSEADPDLDARIKMRSLFKKLMASQYACCLAIAAGRQGVFVLALTTQKADAIMFRFYTRPELHTKTGQGWDNVIESLDVRDPLRCVVGALEDPDGDLYGTVTIEKWC